MNPSQKKLFKSLDMFQNKKIMSYTEGFSIFRDFKAYIYEEAEKIK